MKYTILGFQQDKLIELELKVDDALLLRTIKDMYASASMEFTQHGGKSYMWVNQTYLLKQIPIIGTKRTLRTKLNNFEELGLIERLLLYKRKGVKGSFSYIGPTKKLDRLEDYDFNTLGKDFSTPTENSSYPLGKIFLPPRKNIPTPTENSSYPLGKIFLPPRKNIPNKDTSIRDSSIKDASIKDTSTTTTLFKKDIDLVIKEWNKLGLQNLRAINSNTKRHTMLKARIEEYSLDEVIQAIQSISKSSFLKGQNPRNWTITFDWLVKPNNFLKVIEGNYLDKEGNKANYGTKNNKVSKYFKPHSEERLIEERLKKIKEDSGSCSESELTIEERLIQETLKRIEQ